MTEASDKTASLLAAMWAKNRPLAEERVALLERAAQAAAAGTLDDTLRAEAAGVAHKLAGSLGMYGYDEGARIARELEVLLNSALPEPARLGELTVELRRAIFV